MGARLDRAPLEAAQAFKHVLRPADRLAELAVTDNINADFGLLAHHLSNRRLQAGLMGPLVIGLAGLFGAQKLLQRCRADQAANMGCQNPVSTAFHRLILSLSSHRAPRPTHTSPTTRPNTY